MLLGWAMPVPYSSLVPKAGLLPGVQNTNIYTEFRLPLKLAEQQELGSPFQSQLVLALAGFFPQGLSFLTV